MTHSTAAPGTALSLCRGPAPHLLGITHLSRWDFHILRCQKKCSSLTGGGIFIRVPRLVKVMLQGTAEHLCLVPNLPLTAGLHHLQRSEQHSPAAPLLLPPSQLLPFRVSPILKCTADVSQSLPGISHPFPRLGCLSSSDNPSSITLHQLENPLYSLNCSHSSPFLWIHNNNRRQLGCAVSLLPCSASTLFHKS